MVFCCFNGVSREVQLAAEMVEGKELKHKPGGKVGKQEDTSKTSLFWQLCAITSSCHILWSYIYD